MNMMASVITRKANGTKNNVPIKDIATIVVVLAGILIMRHNINKESMQRLEAAWREFQESEEYEDLLYNQNIDRRDFLKPSRVYEKSKTWMSIYYRPYWSTFFGPESETKIKFPRGMYGRDGKLELVGKLIYEGRGNREIQRITNVHNMTVAKLRRVIEVELGKPILCKCGQPVTHQGWCSWRYHNSTKRQEFIRNWAADRINKPKPENININSLTKEEKILFLELSTQQIIADSFALWKKNKGVTP